MSKFQTGQITLTTSAQALATASAVSRVRGFIVKAPITNVGRMWIGETGVTTTTGYPIEPGDEVEFVWSMELGKPKFDVYPSDVYVVGTAGDKAVWLGGGH